MRICFPSYDTMHLTGRPAPLTCIPPLTADSGSGGTANSLSTAQNDSAASSARLSSSSTNPSSVETNSARNVKPPGQRSYDDIPAPPPAASRSGFLKNAGRTFSFGINRNSSREINDLPPIPPIPSDKSRRSTVTNSRDRAMTASSVTTATAPRLDDSSFSIKESDDDFGNMFAGIQHKSSREVSRDKHLILCHL